MKKNDRSNINPFTGKKHFNIVNDDKFLDECYAEYNSMINQSQLLDGSPDGKLVADVSLKLIDAVERHLLEIGRSDYTENYYDWEFHLVANDAKNATCMPGGKIMVYSGILPVTADEESLAFLLGHEMAHALLDHGRTKVSTNNAKNVATTAARLGSIGLSLLGHGEVADVVRGATTVADYGSEYFLIKPWGRGHEIEADKLGMMIIHWADYDINKVPAFWQRMSEHSSNNFDFFETHPSDNKRIDAMKKLVLEIPNQKDYQYTPVLSEKSKQKALKDENKEKNKSNLLESFNDFNIFNQNKSEGAEAITNKNVVESVLEVKEDNFCSNCGNPLSTGSSFCSKCGNK
ncbi:MAG: M48 family metalloprotease [Methanobrevibacter sp.]|nr:M48 family metalloprotease [Methanobrevibacter sp.]